MQSKRQAVMNDYYNSENLVINQFLTPNVQLQFLLAKKYISEVSDKVVSLRFNNKSSKYEIFFDSSYSAITIFENTNWVSTKTKIDNILFPSTNSCYICTNELTNKKVSCSGCNIIFCIDCYISIFRKNKGIIKCPSCDFSYGKIHSKKELEDAIRIIKLRSGIEI